MTCCDEVSLGMATISFVIRFSGHFPAAWVYHGRSLLFLHGSPAMTTSPSTSILRHLRGIGVDPLDAAADRELLERFSRGRDEEAFAALLRRHGPMVWRVCRRFAPSGVDAEDAFQATFMRLASHAGSILARESAAGWLYSVAGNAARKLRDAAARRGRLERRAAARAGSDPLAEMSARELLDTLDRELTRLPDKFRVPLVLCYLEGSSREEAARQIGCPLGTLKGRLERGKELLRAALQRRGLSLSAVLVAALAEGRAAGAAVPAVLSRTTLRAALLTTPARGLTAGKLATACVLGLVLTAAGVGLAIGTKATPPPDTPPQGRSVARGQVKTDLFGDSLPDGALLRLGTVRQRHATGTSRAAFTRDNKTVIVSDMGGQVIYWDVATGKEIRRFRADPSNISAMALSPDGKRLAIGSWGKVRLLDAKTGAAHSTWGVTNDSVTQIAFTPDGKTAGLRYQGKSIELWDVARGKKLHTLEGHTGNVFTFTFAPDGKTLASGSWQDPNVRIWDVATGRQVRAFAAASDVLGVAFAPDGKTLATCGNGSRIRFWDPATGKRLRESNSPDANGVTDLYYLPDGKTLVGRGGLGVRAWDAESGKMLRQSEGGYRNFGHLALSPDGTLLATSWGGPHTFDVWDAGTLKFHRAFAGHRQRVTCLAFAPGGKTLFSGADITGDRLTEWDLATGKVARELGSETSGAKDLALSPDGRFLAACDHFNSIGLYELATHKEVRRFKGHTNVVVSACFSGDGKTLATGSYYDKTLRLWDVTTGKARQQIALNQDWPCNAAISPDGKVVAAGGFRDGSVYLWDTASGKLVRKLPTPHQPAYSVAFTADGRALATAGIGPAVHLWDVATGRPLRQFGEPTCSWMTRVAFSPDGRTLAIAGNDNAVSLWEVEFGGKRGKFVGHAGPVHALAFSPDGRRLASGGDDTTILIWDVAGHVPAGVPSATALDTLWADLGGDAATAHRAIWALAGCPRYSVPLLRKRLPRAATPTPADRGEFARLMADLDSDNFTTRQKAEQKLDKLGVAAESLARAALEGRPPLEVRRRLERFIDELERKEKASWTRAVRALEALEHAGGPEARQLLAELAAGDPAGRMTREAKAALGRLKTRRQGVLSGEE
jgi:RNA polymerase sigma factor (sigma-70 family)